MKIQIYSDIMCPFCYIGKRHFEKALQQFDHADSIEVEWKSFQLDPSIPIMTEPVSAYEYLAKSKGMSIEQSKAMHDNVVQMAKNVGLEYNFDQAVVANSFDAHRLIQFAKSKNLGNEAEEALFAAYFTQGKNMGKQSDLIEIGVSIGLDKNDLQEILTSKKYSDKVKEDIQEAQEIGVRGVPFFVFDNKYAVSGAQPVEVFLDTLNKSFEQ